MGIIIITLQLGLSSVISARKRDEEIDIFFIRIYIVQGFFIFKKYKTLLLYLISSNNTIIQKSNFLDFRSTLN